MKKAIGIIVLVAVVALGAYLYFEWEESQEEEHGTFIKPRLEYTTFRIHHIGPDLAKAKLHLLIDNPMPIELVVDSFSYDFTIQEKTVFTSTYPDEVSLKPGDSSHVGIPVTVYRDSLKRVRQQAGKPGGEIDSVTYTIDARFYTNIPLLKKEQFDISYDFRAPLFRSPEVSVTGWSFKGLDDGAAVVNLDLQIINYNLRKFNFKDIDYTITLGKDESVLTGSKPGEIFVGKRDTGYATLPLRLDLGDATDAAWEFLTKGDDLSYRFEATLHQVSKSDVTDESPLTIVATGKLESLEEMVF